VRVAGSGRTREFNFDRVAQEYDESRGGLARAEAAVRDLSDHLQDGTVLEVGVGTGIVAEALQAHAPQIEHLAGVDISEQMLARAAQRLPGRLLRASALRLPFADGQFDCVIAVHVLHLIPDLDTTLAEMGRVLRPGGRLVAVHGPVEHHQEDDLVTATRPLRTLIGEPPDSPAATREIAARAGLRCVEQRPSSPQAADHTPAELADRFSRRSWSFLWTLDQQEWDTHVAPVIAALRALPDQHRRRPQQGHRTLSVFEPDDSGEPGSSRGTIHA
jgi:SAM-dependent methyltransferase